MYIISSRDDFWCNDSILPHDQDDRIREIHYGKPTEVKKTTADYKSEIGDQKVLLLCHGYNNWRKSVRSLYFRLERNESNFIKYFNVVVGYTWPGSIGGGSYPWARKRADTVAKRFAKLLETTISACSELGVMSHSMGCLVSLIAHKELKVKGKKANKHWQFLMAASVNDNSIQRGRRYFDATSHCDKTYVFYSDRDGILQWYPDYEKEFGGKGEPALGYAGPRNPAAISDQTKVVNCRAVVGGHSSYQKTPEIYQYIGNELQNNYPAPKYHDLPRAQMYAPTRPSGPSRRP